VKAIIRAHSKGRFLIAHRARVSLAVLVFSAGAAVAADKPKREAHVVAANLMVEQDIGVTTRVSGVVESIQADRGAEVRKGQPLATLDQREFELDRRASAETLKLSEFELQRYQELFKQKLTSEAELQHKKAAYELARVEFERAKLTIDRSVIRAPFDGVVVDRFVRVGQKVLVDESQPLFKLMSFEPLLARAYLPEAALSRVRVGEEVAVTASEFPDARSTGRVTFVSPVVDPASGSVQVIVRIARDSRRLLRPGMSVQIAFP
jgi:membrane fusion protein (multidrug efflux system)